MMEAREEHVMVEGIQDGEAIEELHILRGHGRGRGLHSSRRVDHTGMRSTDDRSKIKKETSRSTELSNKSERAEQSSNSQVVKGSAML